MLHSITNIKEKLLNAYTVQSVGDKTPNPDSSKNTSKEEEGLEAVERLDRLLKGENPFGADNKMQKLPDKALRHMKMMIPNLVWMIRSLSQIKDAKERPSHFA